MITLSNKLSRVVSDQGMDCISGMLNLEKNDINALIAILSEKQATSHTVDRKRAVNAFLQVTKDNTSPKVLEKILRDTTEQEETRIAAADGLGKYGDSKSEATLINIVGNSSGNLKRTAIKALGRIGTEKSLPILENLEANTDLVFKSSLEFARTLIAARMGDATIASKNITASFKRPWVKQAVSKLTKKQLKIDIEALRGNTFGINLNENVGYEISCGNQMNKLFLSEKIKQGDLLSSLGSQFQIAGIIASGSAKEVLYTLRFIILTQPVKSGIDVFITRTSGELVYSGCIKVDGKTSAFTIRDVGISGTPANINGTVSDNEITFDVEIINQRRVKSGQRI